MRKIWVLFLMLLAGVCVGAPVHRVPDRLYVAPDPFPTNGLISYWSMDSVSGTNVFDDFGSNDGTTVGTPTFSAGKNNDAVDLNGSSQYITEGDLWFDANVTGSFTFSGWFYPQDIASVNVGLFTKYNVIGNQRSVRVINNAGTIVVQFGSGSGVFQGEYSTLSSVLSSGVWNHITCTHINSIVSVYINGLLVSGSVTSGTIPTSLYNSTSPFIVGYSLNGTYFNGSIDEVAIYNRALSSNEVSTIYNSGTGKFYTP